MRLLRFTCLSAFIGILFSSCDNCKNLDCIYDNFEVRFRLLNASGNADLLFGPTRTYDRSQISFFSVRNGDTTFLTHQFEKSFEPGIDSILSVRFFPNVNMAFMRLGSNDVDTFHINYKTYTTHCCGTITEISNLRFNNSLNIPGSRRMQEIRK